MAIATAIPIMITMMINRAAPKVVFKELYNVFMKGVIEGDGVARFGVGVGAGVSVGAGVVTGLPRYMVPFEDCPTQ